MGPIRTLVIASSLALRAGLRALLENGTDVEVAAESAALGNPEALPAEVDVLVAAGSVPASTQLEETLKRFVGLPGLVLMTDDPASARFLRRLPLRAWGILPMDASAEELVAAVRAVHEGLIVCPPALLDMLLPDRGGSDPEPSAGAEALTDRETEVLGLLARGLANKQIAGVLGISEHTVKFHVSSIYGKLGATNRAEAVRLGARLGLIPL
jgi:DNA-binding NarL/FixJ family response regulator